MTETVSGRLPDELVQALDDLGKASGKSRSEVLRIVVQRGLDEVRMERGLEAYRKGEASLARAAEIAGAHLIRFLDALREAGIPFHYGTDEMAEDLAWAESS